MSTLYIETNLLVGLAKGREPQPPIGPTGGLRPIEVVIPGICVMEAFSQFEAESKQWNKVKESLNYHIGEARRDRFSSHAASLLANLEQSIVSGDSLLNEIRDRLGVALDWLVSNAEIIQVDQETVRDSLNARILDDPTDNLIFHSVLRHAGARPAGPRAFVSANRHDFGQPDVMVALGRAGVRYFPDLRAAVGWLGAQANP